MSTRSLTHAFLCFILHDIYKARFASSLLSNFIRKERCGGSVPAACMAAVGSSSDVWVMTEFAGAEGEACVDGYAI